MRGADVVDGHVAAGLSAPGIDLPVLALVLSMVIIAVLSRVWRWIARKRVA